MVRIEGTRYKLGAGDLIVLSAGAAHEVPRKGRFRCGLFTANCVGVSDNFLEPSTG